MADMRGPGVMTVLLQTLAEICGTGGCAGSLPQPLVLRADAAVDSSTVAQLMAQLAQAGESQDQLVTVQK